MTIRRREDWGRTEPLPAEVHWCGTDSEVAELVARHDGPLGVRGGDLARTLGADAVTTSARFVVDAFTVVAKRRGVESTTTGVAHVVARQPWWRGGWWSGPIRVIANAQYLGRWDVAPRGHPNDGRLESIVVDADMSIRQRWAAWRRLPRGEHVPHPHVHVASVVELDVSDTSWIWIDGRFVGRVEGFRVRIEPGRTEVWVAPTTSTATVEP